MKKRGFSLLEMLVSLFIFTIVSSMLIVKTNDFFKKMRFKADVFSVRNIIQKVRVRAILKYETLKIMFKDDKIDILSRKNNSWKKIKTYNFQDLRLKSNNAPVFYPYGTVSKLFTLYIISQNGIRKLTMNINGRINIY